jgi:hypothetical protein
MRRKAILISVMPRPAILVSTIAILALPVCAHDPITTKITWAREVSRIVYARCLSCHREGGASFSLARYENARPWAVAIKEEVLMRRMPPWNAVKGFGSFKEDPSLTQQELAMLADWVEGGAPEGDPRDLPAVPPAARTTRPTAARKLPVTDGKVLERRSKVVGISVPSDFAGASLRLMAVRPDGSVEPLVWVRHVNAADTGVYWFREKLDLPARTRIRTVPPNGSATLLLD